MEGNKFISPSTPPILEFDTTSQTSEKTVNSNRSRPSHKEIAINLVQSSTAPSRRRPSRGGILSNLLKLDLFEEKLKNQQQQSQKPSRPPLKSIASSRALLQTVGASPQSARNSMYFEDLHKAELGLAYDADVAAQRLTIANEIADILQRQELIMKLGKSLVRTGAPSHRIEAALNQVGKKLEIDGHYAVLPGLIIVTFGDIETHTSETHLIRVSRSLDIGKLERVNLIAYGIAKGDFDLDEASELLDELINSSPTWGPFVLMLGYIISSAFVAPLFFNGSWTDCWISALFGLAVGLLTYVSEKVPMFGNVFEMVVTIPIAISAMALQPHVCFPAIVLSSIVIALPGYSLTCSVMELAAKNLISGVVHLIYAMVYVLFLAFGIGYGCSIWRLVHPEVVVDVLSNCQGGPSPWWIFLTLPLATMGFAIVYGASTNQWLPMMADSAVGYAVYYFVSQYAGPTSVITPSAGAFALGLFGNIYARVTKRLGFVPLMGGIIVLVPGSISVKGAIHLFDGSNTDNTGSFVFQVLAIALSLTLGLFLANLVVYPMGRKKSVFLGY